jgi:hypothetical protein
MRPYIKKLCLTGLLLALMVTPASAQAQNRGLTLHQVIAGVSEYAKMPQRAQLRFAHKDAQDVGAFWQQHGSKAFARVTGEPMLNGQATRANVLKALDRVVEQARAGDWAVIYLAGHGGFGSSRDPEWYYMTHDAMNENLPASAISGAELQARIALLSKRGVTVVLILDCCQSGAMAVPETQALVLAACRSQELSVETADLGNGLFTRTLLDALTGKAANKDGRITLGGVRDYVTQHVQGANRLQNPVFSIPAGMDHNLLLSFVGGAAASEPDRLMRS